MKFTPDPGNNRQRTGFQKAGRIPFVSVAGEQSSKHLESVRWVSTSLRWSQHAVGPAGTRLRPVNKDGPSGTEPIASKAQTIGGPELLGLLIHVNQRSSAVRQGWKHSYHKSSHHSLGAKTAVRA